jgi:hypothetical protein
MPQAAQLHDLRVVDKKVDVDAEFTDIPIEDGRVSGCSWDAEGRGKKGNEWLVFIIFRILTRRRQMGS